MDAYLHRRLFFSSSSLKAEIEDEPCCPCICEEKVFLSLFFPLCVSIHLRHRNDSLGPGFALGEKGIKKKIGEKSITYKYVINILII